MLRYISQTTGSSHLIKQCFIVFFFSSCWGVLNAQFETLREMYLILDITNLIMLSLYCMYMHVCYLQYIGETVLILFSLQFHAVNEDLTQQCTRVSNPP